MDSEVEWSADERAAASFPGACTPDREYHLDAGGLAIAVHEWGSESDPPLFVVHGGFDFARTYDVFAPKLAALGWRVVSWDQRGHGDSQHAPLYAWDGDLRDAMTVMDSVTTRPAPVIGHSKGGALMIQLADAQPFRFSHLVNLDGLPNKRRTPDVAEHERARMMAGDIAGWLDHRRRTANAHRKPGTLDELATRRARMNPRLGHDWLRYLVTVGAAKSADGWRWKLDPSMRFGGFGPWRPEWSLLRLPGLPMPFLGVLGRELEEMGWGTLPHHVAPWMPPGGRCEVLDDTGHFVHIERPDVVLGMVTDLLGGTPSPGGADPRYLAAVDTPRRPLAPLTTPAHRPPDGAPLERITWLTHNHVQLALHQLRRGDGRALLVVHGLGESTPTDPPPWSAGWAGPVYGLDLTGHGASTVPPGGGYSAEILLGDVDAALAHLSTAHPDGVVIVGRGVGAYAALMAAGSRPDVVRGAVLADGPGLAGGPSGPVSQVFVTLPPRAAAPDPYALYELSRDLRPPDYATLFVRLAVAAADERGGGGEPIAVSAVVRPPWLAAVADEVGVLQTTIEDALEVFSR